MRRNKIFRCITVLTAVLLLSTAPSPAIGGDGRPVNIRDEITAYYQRALNREPDPDGLNHYAAKAATSCRDIGWNVVYPFFTSPEFLAIHTSSEAQLDALYRGILNRTPDNQGLEYWLGVLDSGAQDWGEVVLELATSPEYEQRTSAVCGSAVWEDRSTVALEPPSRQFVNPAWEVCYDVDTTTWACRDLRGVEHREGDVPEGLGPPADYVVEQHRVEDVAVHGRYGGTIVTSEGEIFEGCQREDDLRWRCDFWVSPPNFELVRHEPGNKAGFVLSAFRDWAMGTAQGAGACAASLIGLSMYDAYAVSEALQNCMAEPYEPSRDAQLVLRRREGFFS